MVCGLSVCDLVARWKVVTMRSPNAAYRCTAHLPESLSCWGINQVSWIPAPGDLSESLSEAGQKEQGTSEPVCFVPDAEGYENGN